MKLLSLLFSLSLAAATLPAARADDWNTGTGGKPSRHGLSSERGPLTPAILWQGGLPAVIAQPAVLEGNVVAMSRIFNINDVLHGTLLVTHNLRTGDTLWTRELPVDFPATDWRSRVTAIRNGRVYATRAGNGNYSFVYALSAATGAILWRSQDTVNENSTESPSFAPNGDLIIGSFSNVTRIDAVTGRRVWLSSRVSPTSNGNEACVFGDRLYLWEASPQGPKVTAYNLATGARLYSSAGIGGGLVQQLGMFAGPDGTLYAPRTQNNVVTDYLVALRDTNSSLVEKWRVPLGYVPFASFGVGPDGSVYSYSRDRRVIRIHPVSGTILDSSEALQTDFFQPRMAIDTVGILYVTNGGFSQGMLYSFDPNLVTRWSSAVTSVNIGGPAIGSGGVMLVCGVGDDVRAYRGATTGAGTSAAPVPTVFSLQQNYPNPFNAITHCGFRIGNCGPVSLRVYDVLGREVATLVKEVKEAGTYSVQWNADGVASGVYFYRLTAAGHQQTRRMLLTK